MNKLDQLLIARPSEFAAQFRAVTEEEAQDQWVATVWLDGPAGAANGVSRGHGLLHYRGGHHVFRISGLPIADQRPDDLSATGRVMHLRRLGDFSGEYSACREGLAAARGESAIYLKNERGVIFTLAAADARLQFDFAPGAVRVRLNRDV